MRLTYLDKWQEISAVTREIFFSCVYVAATIAVAGLGIGIGIGICLWTIKQFLGG